jgi:putative transcriptional regulator
MIEVLQNKNSATRLQVLVEIALSGSAARQRAIAEKLGITPQAVSDYIRQLAEEKLLSVKERNTYSITIEGVNWMLRMTRELNAFIAEASSAVRNITTCAAIAESNLSKGQKVGLSMKDGVLVATATRGKGARGTVVSAARAGQDVGVTGIEGLVDLTRGKISVLEIPAIQAGGSARVDIARLKKLTSGRRHVGSIGIEALAALRRAGREPGYAYGACEAAMEQARCGLSPLIAVSSDAVPDLVKRLQESGLEHEVINLASGSRAGR